jgi:hypothetical protein
MNPYAVASLLGKPNPASSRTALREPSAPTTNRASISKAAF